ncbi:MAG: hypothetical protein QME61_01815 [Patescibacteria group bacterium]|nr:hypothetical protein [Patescibacteria group bacterium]
MNKKIIIGLIGICLIGLVLGLILIRQPKPPAKKVHPLCLEFEPAEGEISCQEAIEIAKKEFKGEIESIEKKYNFPLYFQKIDKKEVVSLSPFPSLEIEGLPKIKSFERKCDFWLVRLKAETEISREKVPKEIKEKIEKKIERRETIIIDLHTGKIL